MTATSEFLNRPIRTEEEVRAGQKVPTQIRVEVTAYFTSNEVDFEKSAAFGIVLDEGWNVVWPSFMPRLLEQAALEATPFDDAELMTSEQVDAFLAKKENGE